MTEYCFGFVEDKPSAAIAKRLLAHANEASKKQFQFLDGFPIDKRGVGNIRKKVKSYLEIAYSGQRVIVLVDLDSSSCAPTLLRDWFSIESGSEITLPEGLIFRVAVREIESWIMADRPNLASFLGVPIANFPLAPDELPDPKQFLLNVIKRKGHRKWHKEMLPRGQTASIGPMYNEKLCQFIEKRWSPAQAAQHSTSLKKAIDALMISD